MLLKYLTGLSAAASRAVATILYAGVNEVRPKADQEITPLD
jgi:hypothetical protein